MNWAIEIFSDKSDQARLITILITSIIAILIVLLNQWFNSQRDTRELLIGKIEELFNASNEYIFACKKLMSALSEQSEEHPERYYEYPKEIVNKLNDSIAKMEMICGLYFIKESFNPEEYYIGNMPILEIAHKGKILPEGEGYMKNDESKEHIRISRTKLDKLCKKLMQKYGH